MPAIPLRPPPVKKPSTVPKARVLPAMSQEELDVILRKHAMYQSGRMGGQRAVIQYRSLGGLKLNGRALNDSDLTGSALRNCDLSGALLDNAVLFGCDLSYANMAGASLARADLRGARLRGASLAGADLTQADLRDGRLAEFTRKGEIRAIALEGGATELVGAVLAKAKLTNARLIGSFAMHTDFRAATLRGCKLTRADLRQAAMTGANLECADLSGADLRGADLRQAVLLGADLDSETEIAGANLEGVIADHKISWSLAEPDFKLDERVKLHEVWASTRGLNGKPVNLSRCDLRRATCLAGAKLGALKAERAIFIGVDLTGIGLQAAQLDWADFSGAKLAGADLRGAHLVRARFNGADLRAVNFGPLVIDRDRLVPACLDESEFRGADLTGANMQRASMRRADLGQAQLEGADLSHANLNGAITDGASGLAEAIAAPAA